MADDKKFGHALKWAYVMTWGQRGLGAILTFVLAAILGPKDFGIVAIAMIYILFMQMLLDQGLVAALIQRKDLCVEHLDSVFWLVLTTSIVLVCASFGVSRWWATANHAQILVSVISALSICIPIEGLAIVQKALFQRDMDFRRLSVCTNASVCFGGAIGIGMALTGFGIWALVGQQISKDFVELVLLWTLSHWRPRWRFSLTALKELFGFSASNFVAKLGVFASSQADSLLLGLFFGPLAVGLYRFAERIMNTVLTLASSSLQAISLPEFSRWQDRPAALRGSVLSCLRLSAIMTFPALAGLGVTSSLLMEILGPTWIDAADVLKLLCLAGVFISIRQLFGPVLQAIGKPQYGAMLTWLETVTSGGVMFLVALHLQNATVRQQIMGIATARLSILVLVGIPVLVVLIPRLCPISPRDILGAIAPSLAAAAAVIVIVTTLYILGSELRWDPRMNLAFVVPMGAMTGGIVLYRMDEVFRQIVQTQVFEFFRGARRARKPSRAERVVRSGNATTDAE